MTDQTPSPSNARRTLHHAVRAEFTTVLARYFKEHPERLDDADINARVDVLFGLLIKVLRQIDNYEILERQERRKSPCDE